MSNKQSKRTKKRGMTSTKQKRNRMKDAKLSGPPGTIPYKTKNGGTLHMFAPGHSGNPNGRPRKFVTTLGKDFGYTNSQIVDTFKSMINMSEEELEEMAADTDLNILERTLAKALMDAGDKGNLGILETVITRAFGSPRQILEQKVEQAITDNRIDLKKLDVETLRKLKAARIK